VGHPEYATNAFFSMLWVYAWSSEYDKLYKLKEDILNLLKNQFNLKLYVYTFCAVALSFINTGRWDKGVAMGNEALKMAEKFSDKSLISHTHLHIAHAYLIKGDMIQAQEHSKEAVDKAPTPFDELWAQIFQTWVLCCSGETQKGIETLEANLPAIKAVNFPSCTIDSISWLGEAYLLAGEYEKASQALNEVLVLAEKFSMKLYFGKAHYFLGEIALKRHTSKASMHFQNSIDTFQNIKAEYYLARSYSGYGRYYKQEGETAQACNYLTKALEIFDRLGVLNEPDKVKKELDELTA
jgi:tetratricopeptide (TPR) repeat protein